MHTKKKILLALTLALFSLTAVAQIKIKDSLSYEVLITNNILKDIPIDGKFIHCFDITPKRLILMATPNQYYLVGWGGLVKLGKRYDGGIGAFAYTPDSILMTIRNKELCLFDSMGVMGTIISLPGKWMGITAGKYVMYLYDRYQENGKYSLFILAKGGKYLKLLEANEPIMSVVEMNNQVMFTSGSKLYSCDIKNKLVKAIAGLPPGKILRSVTVDTAGKRIYLASDSAIYFLKDSALSLLTNVYGGIIRYFNNGLIVFNQEKNYLIRILGINKELARLALEKQKGGKQPVEKVVLQPVKEILTNEKVVNMVKAKISDQLIIDTINSSDVSFDLSVDSMINLSNQNVSSAVIMAMRSAMKNKGNNQQNR